MASEDNFLRLDPLNYDSELEELLFNGSFSFDDCKKLYKNKKMSTDDFAYCKEFFNED